MYKPRRPGPVTSPIPHPTTKTRALEPVAGFLKTLSDPTRLGILELLFTHGELCVCELMDALCVSQPKASRHLATLRRQHLIRNRRRGTWIYYRLDPKLPKWQRVLLEALETHPTFRQGSPLAPARGRDCPIGRKSSARTVPARP